MSEIILSSKQQELIEKLGVVLENAGYTPAQARIVGLLVVSDKVELSFDQIRSTLSLSKSATSNSINTLLKSNRISYSTKMGDRKRYFKSKVATLEENIEGELSKMLSIKEIYQEILMHRTCETIAFNNKLKTAIDFLSFMQEELPSLFKKWKKQKK